MLALECKMQHPPDRLVVDRWFYVPKHMVTKMKESHPELLFVSEGDVPIAFYRNPKDFYYDNGKLIDTRGLFEDVHP